MKNVLLVVLAIFGLASSLGAQRQRKCGIVVPTSHREGVYTAGELGGRHLGDLYAGYIGVKRILPKVSVDAGRQLDSLWRVKRSCYKNPVLASVHRELLESYRKERTPTTLGEFARIADKNISTAKNDMDWTKFSQLYHLSSQQAALVQKLSARLTGRDFVAYGMTELMPTAEGELNLQVLEFLVRNYGPEFVYRIPAVHDKYASFGFFQFTSFAVNGKTLEGASRASLALRRNPLPGSVAYVRDELQFRAAYLFAIHNIARMVKVLNKKELAVLNGLGSKNHDDLIQFIAAAHNGPKYAQTGARRWLNNRMRAEFYVSVSDKRVSRYAFKTKANLAALSAHPNLTGILYGYR